MKRFALITILLVLGVLATSVMAQNPADPLTDFRVRNNNRACLQPFYNGGPRGFFASVPILHNLDGKIALTSFNQTSENGKVSYSDFRMICESDGEVTINLGAGPTIEEIEGKTFISSRVGIEVCYADMGVGIILPPENRGNLKGEVRVQASKNYYGLPTFILMKNCNLFVYLEEGGGEKGPDQRYGISTSIVSIEEFPLEPINLDLAYSTEEKGLFVKVNQRFETKRLTLIPEIRTELGAGGENYFGGAISLLPKL